ncbi:hypothetical protein KCU93_g238, partial [Aureobasidium melanogenum]
MPSFLLPTSGSTLTTSSIGHCDVRSRLCQQLTLEALDSIALGAQSLSSSAQCTLVYVPFSQVVLLPGAHHGHPVAASRLLVEDRRTVSTKGRLMVSKCVRPALRPNNQVPHASLKFSIFVVLQGILTVLHHTRSGESQSHCSTGAWLYITEIVLASICNHA